MSSKNGDASVGIELSDLTIDTKKPAAVSRQQSKAGNRSSLMELHVFLPDLTFLTLMIDQQTKATEIMDMIISTLGLNQLEARRVLSLWLTSADLELQLKPNHIPTQLFTKWPVYLHKYTSVSEKALTAQKPLLHLRRNIYISRDEDLKVSDPETLDLLFTEARFNVMNGTYPCDKDLIVELAGILCTLQYGPYDEQEHTADFYKCVHSILPLSVQSNSKLLEECCELVGFYHKTCSRADGAGQAAIDDGWYKSLYSRYLHKAHTIPFYGNNQATLFPLSHMADCKNLINELIQCLSYGKSTSVVSRDSLKLNYISLCSKSLLFYGSAFFDAFIERVNKKFLHSFWLPVRIAANTDGVYIISSEKEEPLLGILYEELTWEFVDTENCPNSKQSASESESKRPMRVSRKVKASKDKVACMPSLLLQYPAQPDEQSEGVKFQVLRVYSKAARLVDAFIQNCSDMMKQRVQASPMNTPDIVLSPPAGGDNVDGPRFPTVLRQDSSNTRETLERSIKGLVKPRKLLCQSFTEDGRCVSP